MARHRYHIVWITKYRYKVLEGALRERIRTIIRQLCKELSVQIVSGVLSREHVHMFVEIPPHIAVTDFVRRVSDCGDGSLRIVAALIKGELRTSDATRKSLAGRKPWDEVMIFKALVLQALYNLSDDQAESGRGGRAV